MWCPRAELPDVWEPKWPSCYYSLDNLGTREGSLNTFEVYFAHPHVHRVTLIRPRARFFQHRQISSQLDVMKLVSRPRLTVLTSCRPFDKSHYPHDTRRADIFRIRKYIEVYGF